MLPPRSELSRILARDAFIWAAGIEDTVITAPWPATGRTLDQYELTEHHRRWAEDLGLMAELGVGAARYGVPWHLVQPAADRWDWSWADRPLERLLALGIDPIVDLVHYGLPPWLEGAYLAPDFPARMAEFAARLAERYRGRIRWYTPLNEPRITAWYCGKLGWWPPQRRGWRGYAQVLLAAVRGIAATVRALRAADPGIVDLHVEAADDYRAASPDLEEEARLRTGIMFLGLDLLVGRVDHLHPLHAWLLRQGVPATELAALRAAPCDPPAAIGLNLYPQFSSKIVGRADGRLRIRSPYGDASLVTRLAQAYAGRYGRPLLISETASIGPPSRRVAWLGDSLRAVRELRAGGVPVVGYTWWPLFALVAWAYRQGRRPPAAYLQQMGLWDLVPGADGLARVRTAVADAYAAAVGGGTRLVGPLVRDAAHVP